MRDKLAIIVRRKIDLYSLHKIILSQEAVVEFFSITASWD